MSDELNNAVLTIWSTTLAAVEMKIDSLAQPFREIAEVTLYLKEEIDKTLQEICTDQDVCESQIVADFFGQGTRSLSPQRVSSLIAAVGNVLAIQQDIVQAENEIGNIVATVRQTLTLITKTLTVLEDIPSPESLTYLVTSGQLQRIEDIWKALSIVTEFPKLFDQLTDEIGSVSKFTTDLGKQAVNLADSFKSVISEKWLGDPSLSTPQFSVAAQGILSVQSIFFAESERVTTLVTEVTEAFRLLKKLPFNGQKLVPEAKVASYRRWSDVSLDLICSNWRRQDYSAASFAISFDYPEFETCFYEGTFPWPNQHIPYFKFSFAKLSSAQLADNGVISTLN